MARGDSYQLQGQQGGVYLTGSGATGTALGKFRVIHALSTTVINSFTETNIIDSNGAAVTNFTLAAGTQLGGQFKDVALTSGTCICYYA
jgi:hypothetical protein